MTYSMTCTCGDVMTVDGQSREEAVEKMKDMMTQEMLDQHWQEKHAQDEMPKPTIEQAHIMIDHNLVDGDGAQPMGN